VKNYLAYKGLRQWVLYSDRRRKAGAIDRKVDLAHASQTRCLELMKERCLALYDIRALESASRAILSLEQTRAPHSPQVGWVLAGSGGYSRYSAPPLPSAIPDLDSSDNPDRTFEINCRTYLTLSQGTRSFRRNRGSLCY